ncbi:transmembrane signal receptor [Lithospermum erythrorhizon]|uniref:Transmembrane signal receptor n=1 Tax=Lithospermum erythrorhizon TaxID=34254 RepID=A0AAV3NTP1_LITER
MGKQHRVTFNKYAQRKEQVLDLVYSDLCGPMTTKTLGGYCYFVTFIDNHSRRLWAYPLKTKDQVYELFKQFHVMVERESGKTLKCIRTDNGGEYIGLFDQYCRAHGIRHEQSVPKTPQHNGLAERMNRTIMEKVRCMLSHSNLPKTFWGEALCASTQIINLSPTTFLEGKVPEEVWSGGKKRISYKHLRVFGCRAIVHVPKDERTKLDNKAKQYVFLSYGDDKFGYKLYDPIAKKVIRSRDVTFFEEQTIKDFDKDVTIEHGDHEVIDSESDDELEIEHQVTTQENSRGQGITGDVGHGGEINNDQTIEQGGTDILDPPSPNPTPMETRTSTRVRLPSTKYSPHEYVLLTDEGEPTCFQETLGREDEQEWVKAMKEEMNSLEKNKTFILVDKPPGQIFLKNRWVYKIKIGEDNIKPRYKARLVVKGFGQRQGIDYEEIFSPVVKLTSIRVILGLVAHLDLEIEQLDVKTAFLHGDLEEDIFMEQPEGFEVKGKEHLVCKLEKSLYGLKQAPRQWYKKFDSFMGEHGFTKTLIDHCVFIKRLSNNDFVILLLYVDDMLIVGKNMNTIKELKCQLSKAFEMKDLGSARYILGMEIKRDRARGRLWLSQEKYIHKVLARFNMESSKSVSCPLGAHFKLSSKICDNARGNVEDMEKVPYASAIGSLMYAMLCTRPDIAYSVGLVSRFLSQPRKEHWEAVKWILRYLKGTSNVCLCYGTKDATLESFTDSDMAGDLDSKKSTSGYLFTFVGGAISWQSKLQRCVALSTTEAEYIAITECCKELLWLKRFFEEIGIDQKRFTILCDSQSAIHLSKNPSLHSKSKHIQVRYHWIRDVIEEKQVFIEIFHTCDNGADMMTKVLPKGKHDTCCAIAGLDTVPAPLPY